MKIIGTRSLQPKCVALWWPAPPARSQSKDCPSCRTNCRLTDISQQVSFISVVFKSWNTLWNTRGPLCVDNRIPSEPLALAAEKGNLLQAEPMVDPTGTRS